MKFRKKPVVIDAVQLTEEMFWRDKYVEHCLPGTVGFEGSYNPRTGMFDVRFRVETPEGPMNCKPGHWWIRGVKGEEYFCDPEVFEKTYEPV